MSTTVTDGEGRVIKQTDADGNISKSYYNVMGQKVADLYAKSPASGATVNIWNFYEYDDAGRTKHTWSTKADGKTILSDSQTIYASDSNGRTETSIGTDGLGSRSVYDGGGRLLRSEQLDKSGNVLSRTDNRYDALGRTVSTFNKRGVKNTTEYDDLGRTKSTKVTAPAPRVGMSDYVMQTDYTYDDAGRQRSVGTKIGDSAYHYTVNTYDDLGRPARTYTNAPDNNTESGPYTEIGYDAQGRRESERDEEGRVTYYSDYDAQGHPLTVTLGHGATDAQPMPFKFKYDEYGQQLSVTGPAAQPSELKPVGTGPSKLFHDITCGLSTCSF